MQEGGTVIEDNEKADKVGYYLSSGGLYRAKLRHSNGAVILWFYYAAGDAVQFSLNHNLPGVNQGNRSFSQGVAGSDEIKCPDNDIQKCKVICKAS